MESHLNITVRSVDTFETIHLHFISNQMTIRNLKVILELRTGLPVQLMKLTFLDQGVMDDLTTLKQHDVVSRARLKLYVWDLWTDLVRAVAKNQSAAVFREGVCESMGFENANTRQMTPERRKEWFKTRAFVSLLISAHFGHRALVQELLDAGANVLGKTKNGRNILHIAAANGKNKCIEALLKLDIAELIEEKDSKGETPITSASHNKSASKLLNMFQWNRRTANVVRNMKKPSADNLMAHQVHDSKKTWLSGPYKQRYHSKITAVQEYRGTDLSSKKSDLYERRLKSKKSTAP